MYVARRAGLSQRLLADAFDLSPSRVSTILRSMEATAEAWGAKGDELR
jgi:DNA-binding MarR family transcriptional regulator